jgi:hypothetical protein
VSRKLYRRQTKSDNTAVYEEAPERLIGKCIPAFKCANLVWFESSNGKTWPRKKSISFVRASALKIQHRQIEPSTLAAPAILYEKLLPSLQQYYFNEQMVRPLQRESDSGNCNIDCITSPSCIILLNERAIKHYQLCNSPEDSGVNQSVSKQRWITGSRRRKFAVAIE